MEVHGGNTDTLRICGQLVRIFIPNTNNSKYPKYKSQDILEIFQHFEGGKTER